MPEANSPPIKCFSPIRVVNTNGIPLIRYIAYDAPSWLFREATFARFLSTGISGSLRRFADDDGRPHKIVVTHGEGVDRLNAEHGHGERQTEAQIHARRPRAVDAGGVENILGLLAEKCGEQEDRAHLPARDGRRHNANQVLSIPSSTQSRYKGVSVMMEGISISKITS